jgi:hypothetical protein
LASIRLRHPGVPAEVERIEHEVTPPFDAFLKARQAASGN